MLDTVIGALLPIVVTLFFGFFAGWHKDFDGKEATTLNRMVMLYALPLSLFSGIITTPKALILQQGPMAFMIFVGMIGGYAVVYALSRYVFHRPSPVAALQALAISGPAVPFVGVSVLGHLFGSFSSVPIAISSLYMNLIQVPVTLYILSSALVAAEIKTTANTDASHTPSTKPNNIKENIIKTIKEPVVWAPVFALILLLSGLELPPQTSESFALLAKTTGGIALFASGIILFSRKVGFTVAVGVSVIARNIIIPLLMLGLGLLFSLGHKELEISILSLSIPTASICVILAVQYKTAEQEMASVLFFSTLFSMLTMGAFIYYFS